MSHQQHLNQIWLHGTAEEKEAVRLLFLDLALEMNHPRVTEIQSSCLDITIISEWLGWMSPKLTAGQEELLTCFLEDQVREIRLRRERDITLI